MDISRFAVIGHPIGHTMSPFIPRASSRFPAFSPAYDVLDVPVLGAAFRRCARSRALTSRFRTKSAILPFLDAVDEKAALFGSVNTVKNESGRMTGYDGRRRLRKGPAALRTGFFRPASDPWARGRGARRGV